MQKRNEISGFIKDTFLRIDSPNRLPSSIHDLAHEWRYLLFKPENSSPSGAEGSTELGGRQTRWEYAIRVMRI
jgi:hypothetical protein